MEIRPDELIPYSTWLEGALLTFVIILPIFVVLATFIGFLVAAARRGPSEGFYTVAKVIARAVAHDLPAFSLRRTWAIARLSIQEAVRSKVLVAFVVFAVVTLFAGWYLDVESTNPARLYMGFVFGVTNLMALVLAVVLSIFSIPNDIKNRTIYTVVTKPVTHGEIVLGKILGFSTVGTILLLVMGAASLIFVNRGLNHQHAVNPRSAESTDDGWTGVTSRDAHHRHTFTIEGDSGFTDPYMGHTHAIAVTGEGAAARFELGPPQGHLQARVPIYGRLRFHDRQGVPVDEGVNVGKEWGYRTYIEGRTLHTAIWTFDGLRGEDFPDSLPLSMTLSVFRTYKADIEKGVRGVVIVVNPNPQKNLQSEPISFESQEFTTQTLEIPRKLKPFGSGASSGRQLDLFDDLMEDGSVEIWLRCDDRQQYFGMAQADVYIAAENASFMLNFFKGYVGIWLQMLLVTSFGVMFSTFLSSPVTLLATVTTVLIGYNQGFIADIYTGEAAGGGPIESLIKLQSQDSITAELDIGDVPGKIVTNSDRYSMLAMVIMSDMIPRYDQLSRTSTYVANNFNIQAGLLARHILSSFVYLTIIAVMGYFFLRTREVAA